MSRRLLSSWPSRRLGPQLPLDVQRGRTARHAQTWADQPDPDHVEVLRTASGIVRGALIGVLMWAGLIAFFIFVGGCGAADDLLPPPANPNTSTCYRCEIRNSALVETSYACSSADAQQFGRRCFR